MSCGSFLLKYNFHSRGTDCKCNIFSRHSCRCNQHLTILTNIETLKMTTGSAELDSLIDSIQEGQFYLFYGRNKAILDGLVHGLLVNCVLPVREHGFESMAVYING